MVACCDIVRVLGCRRAVHRLLRRIADDRDGWLVVRRALDRAIAAKALMHDLELHPDFPPSRGGGRSSRPDDVRRRVDGRASVGARRQSVDRAVRDVVERLHAGRSTRRKRAAAAGGLRPQTAHGRRRGRLRPDAHVAPPPRHGGRRRARRRARGGDGRGRSTVETRRARSSTWRSTPTHSYIADGMLVHNSVYRFRGADYRNILQFEEAFPEVTTVVLDQNYRSTQTILDAANAVISNNAARKPKNLWTDAGSGDRIVRYHAEDEGDEATFVASTARQLHSDDAMNWRDVAVLYRTNAQSRVIEEAMMRLARAVQGRRRHPLLRPARGQGRDGLPAGGRQPGRRGQRQAGAQHPQARGRRRQHRQGRRPGRGRGHRLRRRAAPGRRGRRHRAGGARHRRRSSRLLDELGAMVAPATPTARSRARRRTRRPAAGRAGAARATSPSWRPRTPSSRPGGWRTSASSSDRPASSPRSTSSSSRSRWWPTPTTCPTARSRTRSC